VANIQQAAKWMRKAEEVKVRRASEPLETFHQSAHFDGAIMESRCESISSFARMTVEQLLAEDWEIAH
jgi:hypothetical protein